LLAPFNADVKKRVDAGVATMKNEAK